MLRIIPYYTGKKSLKEVLKDKDSLDMLWLEILFNDSIDWSRYLNIKKVKQAYNKSCIWYANFSNLIDFLIKRKRLKKRKGKIDEKELRKFWEVINFVSG